MALANVNNNSYTGVTQIVLTGISSSSGQINWLVVGTVTASGVTLSLIDSVTYTNIVTPLMLPSSAGFSFSYIGIGNSNEIVDIAITDGTQTIFYQTNVGLFITSSPLLPPQDLTQFTSTNSFTLAAPAQTVTNLTVSDGCRTGCVNQTYVTTLNSGGTESAQQYARPDGFPGTWTLLSTITFNPATDPNTFTSMLYDRPNEYLYIFASKLVATPELVIVKIPISTFASYATLDLGPLTTNGPANSTAIDCSYMYLVQSSPSGLLITKIDLATFSVLTTLTVGSSATLTTANNSATLLPHHLIINAYDTGLNTSYVFDIDTDTFTLVDTLTLPVGATSVQGYGSTFNGYGFTTTQPNMFYQYSGLVAGGSGQYQGGGGGNQQGVPPNYGLPTSACTACETPIPQEIFTCSLVGTQQVFLNMTNNTNCNIDVWWTSYNQQPYHCQPVYYLTLTSNSSSTHQLIAYVTHVFKFYLNNSNQLIYELPPLTGNTNVVFNCGSTSVTTVPIIFSVYPPALAVGETMIIYGVGFTTATSVDVNGISASFTILSDGAIKIVIPVGATTGRVTVTTPGGTATSPEDATITPPYAPEFTQTVTV
jgi:hypothetical protein